MQGHALPFCYTASARRWGLSSLHSAAGHLSGSEMICRRGSIAGRSTSSMGCGCGTVATFTAVTTTLRCPGDEDVCSFSTSGSTWHPEHTTSDCLWHQAPVSHPCSKECCIRHGAVSSACRHEGIPEWDSVAPDGPCTRRQRSCTLPLPRSCSVAVPAPSAKARDFTP